MGTSRELAYHTIFKGAKSKKWYPSEIFSLLPSNVHIKMDTKLPILSFDHFPLVFCK